MQNRIILVTGASDSVGGKPRSRMRDYGATVILLERNEEKLRPGRAAFADEQHVQPQWFTPSLLTCTAEGVPASGRPHRRALSPHGRPAQMPGY